VRILFITSTRIGDAVLSTGILKALMARHPKARFTVVCGPVAAPLFRAAPQVEAVIALKKKKRSMHWLDLWKQCGWRWWSQIVDLRNAPLTLLFPTLRPIHLFQDPKDRHRVQLFGDLMKMTPPPAPQLWWTPADKKTAQGLLGDFEGITIGIGPTANWRGKTWRAVHFRDLCLKLLADNPFDKPIRFAFFGHSSEAKDLEPLWDGISADHYVNCIGDHDLAVVAATLSLCDYYIGNDSGLMHMAAATRVPTLGLFGPTRENLYAPWGEHCQVVRTDTGLEALFGPDFNHRTTDSLMDSLSVDKTYQAFCALKEKVSS